MIGVFDSGIGGLSVLKALRAALPQQAFIYVADSAHAPYGERDERYVLARSRIIGAYLAEQHIDALVVACNTATAVAVHELRAMYPALPVVGLEPALKPAAAFSRTGHVGVMATRATLSSTKFRALHAALTGRARFTLQACDGLAAAIERAGSCADADEAIRSLCARHVSAMGTFGSAAGEIDTLVLGCTHYPLVTGEIRALVGDGVRLLDTGEAVARQTARLLAASARPAAASGEFSGVLQGEHNVGTAPAASPSGFVTLLTTGQADVLARAASRWLGLASTAAQMAI
ncbi:MAG: glutamate racemase [Haliea sp.]|nr:MAG: glutamate racemase [Haliea sp.]